MNQLIFTDFGVIVGLDEPLSRDATEEIGAGLKGWVEGTTKVLVLPLANWEIVDKRRDGMAR